MLDFNSIMIGSDQPKVLGEFYEKVFDKKPDMQEGGWYGWQFGNFSFNVGEHSEVKAKAKEPQRSILNFQTEDVKKEFERVKQVEGVTVIKEPYEMEGMEGLWIATLADPDGNYFQLMPPWEASKAN
jgi:predicted enzyme related to lactoylglutathione lyase